MEFYIHLNFNTLSNIKRPRLLPNIFINMVLVYTYIYIYVCVSVYVQNVRRKVNNNNNEWFSALPLGARKRLSENIFSNCRGCFYYVT